VGLTPRAQSPARAEGESTVAVARRADTRGPPVGAKGLAAAAELTAPMGLGFRLAGLC
jgi:hypothetical protein